MVRLHFVAKNLFPMVAPLEAAVVAVGIFI